MSIKQRPRRTADGVPTLIPPLAVPRLTVVVCTYDRHDVLPDALVSLLAQDATPGFLEIIVIDNSPDQKAATRFAARYSNEPRICYLLEPAPGLSNARNVGTAQAKAALVAFVDDDAIVAPNWAREIVRAFELYGDRAGVVGGRVIPRWLKPKPAWLSDSLLSYLSIIDWGGDTRELKATEWLAGCNIAFRKSMLVAVGGFSRALGRIGSGLSLLSNDEIEVMEKIQAEGRVSVYAPDATVQHVIDPARLTRAWFRRRAAWQAVSDFIKDGEKASARASAAEKRLRLSLVPGARRAPVGLYTATDDAHEFEQDVALTYDLVISVLSGGAENDVGHPWIQAKATAWARALLHRQPRLGRFLHKRRRAVS